MKFCSIIASARSNNLTFFAMSVKAPAGTVYAGIVITCTTMILITLGGKHKCLSREYRKICVRLLEKL